MKSESWIIAELGASLLLVTILCFFRLPVYEKGAWFIIGAFVAAFNLVMGYKFGKGMPDQATDAKPAQSTQSTSTVTVQAPSEPPDGQ